MRGLVLVCGLSLVSVTAFGQAAGAATPCERLASLRLDGAKVTAATMVENGAAAPAEWKLPPGLARTVNSFCRVQILDTPSADSTIHTEVWLPVAGWNGKLSTRGNGGFAGQIYYDQMAKALGESYATAGTDGGHTDVTPDFALGHPEKVKDFGWRAIHDMTVQAKAVVAAFYGKPQTKAYFAACSDGGREALMEAQRFPNDYDGILAGAPAYNWTGLIAAGGADAQQLLSTPGSYIPASKLPAIGAAVRNACDMLDGVKDGILNDPRTCGFDAETMLCKDGDAATCLTAEQVKTLKEIDSAKVDATGKMIYRGYLLGAEDAPGSWVPWKVGQKAGDPTLLQFFSTGFYRDFVYQDPKWELASFKLGPDYKLATEKMGEALNAVNPDLKAFAAHGGRLILYHGWNDPAIPATGTIDYYDAVKAAAPRAAEDAVRLYMVPGMLHCSGGPGATDFGQDDSPKGDAGHDVLTTLEQWVEAGKAPGTIVARGGAAGKTMTRPVCVYPAAAKYVGGDVNDAGSFVCAVGGG